jgi:hypothetical protein
LTSDGCLIDFIHRIGERFGGKREFVRGAMKAFEFDHRLIDSYARFSRSFSTIRPDDLKTEINNQYDAGRFWPDALLSLNPQYLKGPTVDALVASGDLDEATGRIFRFGAGHPLRGRGASTASTRVDAVIHDAGDATGRSGGRLGIGALDPPE